MAMFFELHLRSMGIPFSQSDIDLLLNNSTLVYYKKGTKFTTQGEDCLYACFLLSGIMRRHYIKEEVENTVSYFSKGDWVGDYYSFINEIPASFCIEAVVDCSAMLFNKKDLVAIFNKSHMIERYGRKIIEKAYLKMLNSSSTRPRKSSKEAYLEFVNLYPEIMKVVPLKQIANYLNIQPESLSRIRRQLANGN